MQTEKTPIEGESPTPSRQSHRRLSRRARWCSLGLLLLVPSVMGAAALTCLVPQPTRGMPRFTERLAWYYHQGQLKADLQTLASVVEYIVTSDSGNWGATTPTNPPVAHNASPTQHKS